MNEQGRQDLSCLMDGELGSGEMPGVVDALVGDPGARDLLGRYTLIGEVLRGQASVDAAFSLRSRVGAALDRPEAEPGVHAVPVPEASRDATGGTVTPLPQASVPTSRGNRKGFGPLALAASVLLAAVIGFLGARQLDGRDAANVVAAGSPAPAARPVLAGAPADDAETGPRRSWDAQHPAVQRRLRRYLVDHSEYLGRGMRGMHPYARVAAYASAPGESGSTR